MITAFFWQAYSATMNNFGLFKSNENSNGILCFYENEQYIDNGNVIYSADNNLFINGKKIAELQDFFRILTDTNDIFIVTRRTIFKLSDNSLEPVITFNEMINDLTYENGKFHVALRKNTYNGYKFTHVKLDSDNYISTVDTAVLNLKKLKMSEDMSDPYVYKNSAYRTDKDSY